MKYTISTHNGNKVAYFHNIRDRRITDKEKHIDPQGEYEIWHDEPIEDAYKRLFGDALEKYNAKQKREDRKIKDYLQHVKKDKKKNACCEMIISIGNNENRIDDKVAKEIYKEFLETWSSRNPNLVLIGSYYHNDEGVSYDNDGNKIKKGVGHVHIDYIPVAHGYSKGLETQNGLVKALSEMGFEGSRGLTAQTKWVKSQNEFLEQLCNARGIKIEHPMRDGEKREHLETKDYKLQETIKEHKKEKEKLEEDIDLLVNYHNELIDDISELKSLQNIIKIQEEMELDEDDLER